MALDPRLSLMTKTPNYSDVFYKGLTQGQQVTANNQQLPIKNRMLEAQATGAEQDVEKRDRALEFDSVLEGALELENLVGLDGDLTDDQQQKAIDYLTTRTQEIQRRGGTADDTMAAIDFMRNGDIDSVRNGIQNVKSVARQTGKMSKLGEGVPASVTEFNSLIGAASGEDPLMRDAARIELGLDRKAGTETAPQIVNVGGVPHIFDKNKQKLVRAEVEGETVTTDTVATSEAKIAATKAAAEASIKMSQDAIEGLGPVRKSIANIDDAIRAINEGAGTGAVQSFFPSVKASSVELDNIRGQMGLDVIGGTTFGALSEAELKFALDTALPTRLDGPELKAWLQRKKSAQQKMSKELESAAIYLGQPGNTPAGYLEFRRNTIDPQEAEAQSVTDLVNKYAQ